MQICSQLQKLRKLRKMSLTDLSRDSGVQIATLSRMENNKMTGTLNSHFRIAKTLGIDITELYRDLQDNNVQPVEPEEKLEVFSAPDGKVSCEILARKVSAKKMLPALLRIAGKTSTPLEQGQPAAEKFIFVLSGTVVVHVRSQAIKLTANSSLYLNASFPHSMQNPLSVPAKVLSVTTPVTL